MNSRILLVPFLIVVAVVCYLTFGDTSPEPTPMTPTAASPAASQPAAAAELAKAAVAPGKAASDATTAEGRTAAPAADAPVAGTSTIANIRGRVVDGQGAPRAGVELSLRTWPDWDGNPLDSIPMPAPGRNRERDDEPKATSRSDGTFVLQLPKSRMGQLEVASSELVLGRGLPAISGKKGDQDLGDVKVLRAATVAGIVRDERSQPVAGVRVGVAIDGFGLGLGGSSSATSAADGTFKIGKLQAGKWQLRTASGKFLPTVVDVEIAPEEQRTDVVLVVKPGNAIAGQVIDDRGVGVANMKVGSKRKEARGSVDIERFSADEATTTDQYGFFTLSGLAEKVASVRTFGPGHSSAVAGDVEVGTGNLVLRVERLGSVEGVLQGADGTPIAGSRVTAGSGDGDVEGIVMDIADDLPLPARGGAATTAADGTFRIDNVRPGTVSVNARGKAHRPVRQAGVQVAPAQATKGVRLVADLGATANVKVTDEGGKPVAGATVRVDRASEPGQPESGGGMRFAARAHRVEERDGEVFIGGDERLGSGTTDEQGFVRIHGLPAGDLSITAVHADFAPALAARVTTPKSGAVEAALTLRKPGQAEITVIGRDGTPSPGVEIEIRGVAGEGGQAPTQMVRSGEGGIARVASLAPGNYEAALTKGRTASQVGGAMVFIGADSPTIAASKQAFTVVAGDTTKVELRRPILAKVHGIVTGSDGPAAGCSVELAAEENGDFMPPGMGGSTTTTAADGTFAFDEVEAGRYELRYGKDSQLVKAEQEIVVPADIAEVRQDLTLRTGTLRVQVVASGSGEGVEKAEVELIRGGGEATSGGNPRPRRRTMVMSLVMDDNSGGAGPESTTMTMGQQRAFTDENGVAVVEDVPVGDYTVRVKHKKHAPVELKAQTVVERQTTDCGRVELAAAGQIRGRVLGADGKPARMAIVQTCAVGTEAWGEPEMAMGGSFRITGLAAGRYRVRGQAVGPSSGGYSTPIEVDVTSGETTAADVQLPAK